MATRNKHLLLLLIVIISFASPSKGDSSDLEAWANWKSKHGKAYSTTREDLTRRVTFLKNKQLVDDHNRAYDVGKRSFTMALNGFADLDYGDVKRPLLSSMKKPAVVSKPQSLPSGRPLAQRSSTTEPASWDWRMKGVVNVVRDQGQRGSVEAIDVADAVASFSAIWGSRELNNLSAQEVIDCCLPDPLLNPDVFSCIQQHGGLCLDSAYHTGSAPNVCNNASCKAMASPTHGGKEVTHGNESALLDAVLLTPVVVGIDASQPSFQLYSSGVYSDPACSSTMLDHALLLVGYGTDAGGNDYWICRNSWGVNWGEEGYIKIARNHHNMCGIASVAFYPSPY